MITIEELRNVYEEEYGASPDQGPHTAALIALARYVEKKVREQEPTDGMLYAAYPPQNEDAQSWGVEEVYRAMQSVAPSVVPDH